MAFRAGDRLGRFEIVGGIGAGGMGEVYRGRDTRLGRDVAIEVLPGHLIANSERIARFEREARVLASLNHPHIAAIYGLEEATGSDQTTITGSADEKEEQCRSIYRSSVTRRRPGPG